VSVFLVGAVRMHVCVLYVCGMCVVCMYVWTQVDSLFLISECE
jgi:hypothetical protein